MSPAGSRNAPEARARETIDELLEQAGWLVQDRDDMNLTAGDAIAVREFKLEKGHGYVDYLLFVDGHALGVVEAKPAGYPLTSVELQARKYVEGLPASLDAPRSPCPASHRPETLRASPTTTASTRPSALEHIESVLGDLQQRAARIGGGS